MLHARTFSNWYSLPSHKNILEAPQKRAWGHHGCSPESTVETRLADLCRAAAVLLQAEHCCSLVFDSLLSIQQICRSHTCRFSVWPTKPTRGAEPSSLGPPRVPYALRTTVQSSYILSLVFVLGDSARRKNPPGRYTCFRSSRKTAEAYKNYDTLR